MAELIRNMIELIKNPKEVAKGGEPEFEKYWTPMHIDLDVLYEAVDLNEELEKPIKSAKDEKGRIDKMLVFVADKVYGGQFTKEHLRKGLHSPTAIQTLQEQILFVARGMQSEATKKYLEKNR